MRIIAGRHRGREIQAPAGRDVRPTGDRARQALFNILEHGIFAAEGSLIAGRPVLDVFAGTGALGLEALSRGALSATFIELSPAARRVLADNIARLGEGDRARILTADATRPPVALEPCALAFLDPPYGSGLASVALPALADAGWLLQGALAVVEIAASEAMTAPTGFAIQDERRYGAARLVFLRCLKRRCPLHPASRGPPPPLRR
jgi:16S rRNA (guanine966-N2)-methyltransferase